jgi:hypothetical protein
LVSAGDVASAAIMCHVTVLFNTHNNVERPLHVTGQHHHWSTP